MATIDVEMIEQAINACRAAESGNRDGVSIPSKDLRTLADVYGTMIYRRVYHGFDTSEFAPEVLEILERWMSQPQDRDSVQR